MTAFDPKTNFGYGTIITAPSPATSGTSLTLDTGQGGDFPGSGDYNCVAWPPAVQPTSSNAEIVRVTVRSSDTFTITRAQEGTTAKSIAIGWQFALVNTIKGETDQEDAINAVEGDLATHVVNTANPHVVTKAQVGLGSVDNTADTAKPVSTAQQTALDLKANLASPTFTGTVSGITATMVGLGNVDNTSDATKNAASVTLSNHTLNNTNTITVKDTLFTLQDDGDATKQVVFQLSGIGTGTTRTITIPNASSQMVLTGSAQTFTAVKTFSAAPVISTITNTGTLTLPTSTDTLVGKATTDTFTNKNFDTAGTGNVFKINGTTVSAVTGTGSVVLATNPTLSGTVTGALTFSNLAIFASGLKVANGTGETILQGIAGTGSGTLTVPAATDTLVGKATTDTLTNKTATSTTNNIAAKYLHSATTLINVGDWAAPTAGQVLTAEDDENASWQTPSASSSLVKNEVPGGSVNSLNTAFTTASAFATGSLRVYKNGIRLKGGGVDFTEGSSAFTMVTAPATGTTLLVDYDVYNSAYNVGTNSIIVGEVPSGSVNSSNATFTTARAYIAGSLAVFINGVAQARTTHFTETTPGSGIFTMGDAPTTGDIITVNYQYNLNPSGNSDTVDGIHASTTATANQLYPLNSNAVFPAGAVGHVKHRQGGTTGDAAWNTVGTSNTDVSAKATVIQTGVFLSSTSADTTITFPTAFTQVPLVFCTVQTASTDSCYATVIGTPTTTQVVIRTVGTNPVGRKAENTAWIAIGQ